MRAIEVEVGAERNYTCRVDRLVAAVIVILDVMKVHGLAHAMRLIQVSEISWQVPVVLDAADVALEVADIDCVKAHERREQPPIRLGDAIAEEIAVPAQPFVQNVQRFKQLTDVLVIGFLRRGEA
jgi:hypothetical protein